MSAIYIHIPYCSQKCSYCNFHFTTNMQTKSLMIKAIIKEIQMQRKYLKNINLNSIYIGGGTPSILSKEDINNILNEINKWFNFSKKTEITFECNPEDLNKNKLSEIKNSGINRLSVGIQSFSNNDLKFMNRSHDANQAKYCIKKAQDIGINNISIDLIYSLPNQNKGQWEKNIKTGLELSIKHMSCYSLTIEKNTKLFHLIKKKEISELDEEISYKQYKMLIDCMKKNDFIHYEISNFCMPGYHSIHNSNYWKEKEYLGIGPSAHSFNTESRQWNVSNNQKYISEILKNKIPYTQETLSNKEKYNEHILSSLRTKWGLNLNQLKYYCSSTQHNIALKKIKKWRQSNHIKYQKGYIILTDKGKFISNYIFTDLFI